MRHWLLLMAGSALAIAGCDGGGGCVIDSDCADFTQICVDSTCQPLGGVREGGMPDATAPRDSGTDAGPRDSGPGEDSGPADAGPMDAGLCASVDLAGTWSVSSVGGASCGSIVMDGAVAAVAGAEVCQFDLTGPPEGTLTLSSDVSLSGVLNTGFGGGDLSCTGTYSMADDQLMLDCVECTMVLARTAP